MLTVLSGVACGGHVAGSAGDSNGDSGAAEGAVPDAGCGPGTHCAPGPADAAGTSDQGVESDSGMEGDGWNGTAVSGASGPPPTCATPALACGVPFPGATAFASAQDAANALVGQWSFCGSDSNGFYPPGQLGEEYTADGTYYRLIAGSGGQLIRNLDPTAIGTWEVALTSSNGIEIYTFGGHTQNGGGLSACPPSLDLLGVEARLP